MLRLLFEIAKKKGSPLYIGFFDLEKAFDKVSRLLLLSKLIKLGIGSCMLKALKSLYTSTFCILSTRDGTSKNFPTYTGIRQGASSSVYLFIIFIDDLINYLQVNCIEEPIIGIMHCLLHADDTAVVSTRRDLFITKCNAIIKYFDENKLSLNMSKSAYMIINGGKKHPKVDIKLSNGMLSYKSSVVYLGSIISDTGNLKCDVRSYIESKRAHVTIKFNNFCRKNYLAPLDIKLKVLNACVTAALLYGCESWGNSIVPSVESLYRLGIKYALSIRPSINNEIVYMESDCLPLYIRVKKQQLRFWLNMHQISQEDPENPISKLIIQGEALNLQYIKYYKELQVMYQSPYKCYDHLKSDFIITNKTKILQENEVSIFKLCILETVSNCA